ncbi:MAG: hypothetical protein ACI9XK_004613 [Granulosicoccus sp.]
MDWLAQDPVTRFLDAHGEPLHPTSRLLANESAQIEDEAGEHDPNVFQAIGSMNEILIKNFMVFQEVLEAENYDLVIGDQAWDVDHYWHEHPDMKKAPIAWFTDFVGWLPRQGTGPREAFLTTDYNAEMIGHIERPPNIRDRSILAYTMVGGLMYAVTQMPISGLHGLQAVENAQEPYSFNFLAPEYLNMKSVSLTNQSCAVVKSAHNARFQQVLHSAIMVVVVVLISACGASDTAAESSISSGPTADSTSVEVDTDRIDNVLIPPYLIPPYSIWRFDRGAPSAESTTWTDIAFDDSDWRKGRAGFGYGDEDDRTELNDMRGNYRGIKIRHHFEINNTKHADELHLYVRFDDGFVAYINGQEVVRAAVSTQGNTFTAEDHEADGFEHFVITNAAKIINPGNNVLAIAGLNRSLKSSDFSLDPVLATVELESPGIAPQLSKYQYLADLNALEKRFGDQSSYLTLKNFNYRHAFATLRANASETIQTDEFVQQLRGVIAQLGDAHAGVLTEFHDAQAGYLPIVLADTDTGVIAIDEDSNDLIDVAHPYVVALDGIALDAWLAAANQYVSQASPQLRRRRGLRELRWISVLRSDLGIAPSEEISITLKSVSGNDQVTRQYSLSPKRVRSGKVPMGASRLLANNIGYLRISSMSNSRTKKVTRALEKFLDTDGLIIDVRDNSGGRYSILESIYGYFQAEKAQPYVSNIGAYRLSERFDDDHLEYRPTYRQNHPDWSSDERDAIESALTQFEPQWQFPEDQFSDLHFMLLGKQAHNKDVFYSKPVVVLANAGSFSATDGFLSAFADLEQVTIVGLPSGGGSGATKRFELPHSGIKIGLSSMVSFRPNGRLYDGNGIEVDVRAAPTISDYLGESDTVLANAISSVLASR